MPGAGATVAAVAGGGPVGRCSAGAGSRATGGPEAGPVSGAAVVPAPEPVGTAGRFATGPGTGAAPAAGPAPTVTRAPRLPAGRFTTEPRATATGLERAPGSRAAGPAPAPGAAAPASVADASASGVTVLASKVTAPAPVTDASASGATVSASEVTAPASLADAPASEATTPAPGGTAPAPPAPQAEVSPAPPERLAAVSPAPPEGLAALDLPGACLLGLALACLVQGLVAGAVPALGAAGVAGVAFLWRERRAPSPLLPPGMLRPGPVAAGLGVLLAASAALSGTLFTATFLLQDTLGLDAPTTARRMVPLAVLMVIGAPLSAVLKKRFGARRVATGGAVLLAAGVLLLARPAVTDSGLATGACAALIGAGFGAVMVTATSVVVHRAAEEHAGVAGGLQQTAMNTGPIIGVALATPLLASGTALPALAAVAALAVPAALALPGPERGTDTPAGA
ncbi:MFS transporter [Streptomyces sp. NPDC006339]|uniref:MFS transporter n=1 Tax=Streptomyces sp. NPDC006339 TaxID=3156755 RepID=UPI0033A135DD